MEAEITAFYLRVAALLCSLMHVYSEISFIEFNETETQTSVCILATKPQHASLQVQSTLRQYATKIR